MKKLATRVDGKTTREYLYIMNQKLEDHCTAEQEWQKAINEKVDRIIELAPQVKYNSERIKDVSTKFWGILIWLITLSVGAIFVLVTRGG